MIVPDLNLILYATIDGYALHDPARRWWEDTLSGAEPVGLVSPVIFGFIRLATSRRVFATPMTADTALAHVDAWLSRPNVEYLRDGPRQLQIALELIRQLGVAANLTTDAQIAAHALAVRGVVYSHDTDFGRFPRLACVDPLASP